MYIIKMNKSTFPTDDEIITNKALMLLEIVSFFNMHTRI